MKRMIVVFCAGVLLASSLVIAAQNQGPAAIEMDGGSRGKVPLPHLTHQKVLQDCNACHSIFPQKMGSIQTMKAEGSLKSKHVMNKLCIKCHRAEKKAGRKAGPVRCSDCHVR